MEINNDDGVNDDYILKIISIIIIFILLPLSNNNY